MCAARCIGGAARAGGSSPGLTWWVGAEQARVYEHAVAVKVRIDAALRVSVRPLLRS